MWVTLMGIRPLSPVERCFCQERLRYFKADGEEGVRVDFCEASRRYLKTVDRHILEIPASWIWSTSPPSTWTRPPPTGATDHRGT